MIAYTFGILDSKAEIVLLNAPNAEGLSIMGSGESYLTLKIYHLEKKITEISTQSMPIAEVFLFS